MTKLENIQESVEALSDQELWTLAEWFDELRAQRWDRQIADDVKAGKLDKFLDEVRADIAAGRSTPL